MAHWGLSRDKGWDDWSHPIREVVNGYETPVCRVFLPMVFIKINAIPIPKLVSFCREAGVIGQDDPIIDVHFDFLRHRYVIVFVHPGFDVLGVIRRAEALDI